MKTLILVRHAKSSWTDPALTDRDRPLNDRGKRDAPKMGKRLARDGVKPDLILTSPARRARTTAKLIARELGCKPGAIHEDDRLYTAEADDLLDVIRGLDDKRESAMLVGHNPEFTDLAHRLSKEVAYLTTCTVAVFAFDAMSWSRVGRDAPAKLTLYSPKQPPPAEAA